MFHENVKFYNSGHIGDDIGAAPVRIRSFTRNIIFMYKYYFINVHVIYLKTVAFKLLKISMVIFLFFFF